MNTGPPSQIFGDRLELIDDGNRRFASAIGGGIQAMIDMVVDQRSLRLADGLFDGMKLLGEVEARSMFIKHLDDSAKMAFGPLQPFDDIRVGFMGVLA